MVLAQITPVIVRVVDPPTPETSVADILIGSLELVGAVMLAALVVGLLAGGAFILVRRLRDRLSGQDDGAAFSATQFTR